MSAIGNMKVGVRLGLGFAVVLLLLIGITILGITRLSALNDGTQVIVTDAFPKVELANSVIDNVNVLARAMRNTVIFSEQEVIKKELARMETASADIAKSLEKLEKMVRSESGKKLFKAITDARARYDVHEHEFVKLAGAGKKEEAKNLLLTQLRPTQNAYMEAVDALIKHQTKTMTKEGELALADYHSARNLMLALAGVAFLLACILGFWLTRSITRPLAQAVDVANAMAIGDLSKKIEVTSTDETGQLLASMQKMVAAIQALVADAAMLSEAAVAGKLATRANAAKHHGDFNRVVAGVNQTLDAVIGPLNVAASYVDQISKGAIPAKITDSYNGDFNTLKNNLNLCIDAVNALVADAGMLAKAAVDGKLETRADAAKHQGDFHKIVAGVNATLDAVIGPLNVAASYVDQISKGAIPAKITDSYNGDFNTLKNNLNVCIDAVNALVADAAVLSKAAVDGKLETRADAAKHQGDFRKIVAGVNQTLDAVIGPLNVAASYVDQISKGAIPAKITDSYNGDFNTLKNNLNVCIDAVNALVADAAMLAKAAVEGKLETRADASKHQGDFRKVVAGVNATLDAVIGPLNVAASYVDQISKGAIPAKITDNYNGDFNTLKNNLNVCINAVNGLVADSATLSQAAVDGKFDTKADAAKHQGDFRKVVDGLNRVMQVSDVGLNEVVRVLGALAKGDLTEKITNEYQGTFKRLKDDSNTTVEKLTEIVSQIKELVDAALRGDFTVRGDANKYQNDFRAMVEGLNRLMQVSDTGLNEVVRVLGALAKGDLTEKITNEYQGTFKRLKDDSNTTVEKLTEIVTSIKESTESINVASKEIASGNTDLSSRTEQQASSLEETASSMEELTSTVKQNAENAKQANQLAAGASEVAVKGGAVVGQVVTTMSSINESSKKIVDIISVIDGIAFQTNILALNAAVEAARAGEQGRGFAVVATEVRTLAQRSAAAAKEIKELIGDSVEKVGAGTKLVDEAGKTMAEIVASVKRVTDIMAEITAASQEQSTGIEQVNTAITQMDEVTQQNAALVEQAAAAAESMEEQAGNLAQAVGIFRLSQQAGRQALTRPVAAKPAGLPAPRKAATVTQHPTAKPKAAKAAGGGGDEWTEF